MVDNFSNFITLIKYFLSLAIQFFFLTNYPPLFPSFSIWKTMFISFGIGEWLIALLPNSSGGKSLADAPLIDAHPSDSQNSDIYSTT